MTRTAVGTDGLGDDDRDRSSDYGVRKYEEDQARRAVLREARKITRDAVQEERPPRPDPRTLPPHERRRADREKR